jgi:hypothetical protein
MSERVSDSGNDDRKDWDDYNKRQEFEHELIHRKTTWLLASQALLFTAYAVTLNQSTATPEAITFRMVVPVIGSVLAAIVWFGVVFVINSKFLSFLDYREHFDKPEHKLPKSMSHRRLQWGANTINTPFTLLPDALLPVAFIVGWVALRFCE